VKKRVEALASQLAGEDGAARVISMLAARLVNS
jgi:hypothetical protein